MSTKVARKKSAGKKATAARRSKTGLVRSYLEHSGKGPTASQVVKKLREGLPVRELNDLQATLELPKDKLALMLGMSKSTFDRRRTGKRLEPGESDRVVRFARLMGRAVEVFASETSAREWLKSPQLGLGGEVPLDFAQTEVGAREVEDLLGRIEQGVYS